MKTLVIPSRCTANMPEDLMGEHVVAELKLDGSRFMLYIGAGTDPYERQTAPNTLLSRHVSKLDLKHVDRTANVPHITSVAYEGLDGTILDGEIFLTDFPTTQSIMGSGPSVAAEKIKTLGMPTFYAWDVPFFRGVDIRGRSLAERRRVLETLVARMGDPHVRAMIQWPGTEAMAHFERVTKAGGEGLIIKDLRLGYGVGWAKWKRSSEVSCFVSGFKAGKGKYAAQIGAIALSVYDDGKVREVGFASGFDDTTRATITADQQAALGRVADIFAQEVSKDGRLRHPTFFRWRDDLNPEDCTLAKLRDDLKKVRGDRQKRGG